MRGGISRVGELRGNEAAGDLLGKLVRLLDGALHALCAVGKHQLRAVRLHQVAALDAHGLGHYDDYAVVPCCGYCCKADTGVAAGRLDDHAVGLEHAALLSVVDHCDRYSVLYAACRIEKLQLCKDLCSGLLLSLDLCYFEKGGASYEVGYCLINFHGCSPFLLQYISDRHLS